MLRHVDHVLETAGDVLALGRTTMADAHWLEPWIASGACTSCWLEFGRDIADRCSSERARFLEQVESVYTPVIRA
ncbi:MAG: hypothetical protein ACLT98_15610 [Eggerthellaceae bacterium]